MLLALFMVVSVTPVSGVLLADENDTSAPAVTDDEEENKANDSEIPAPEKDKEIKKPAAEAPKEQGISSRKEPKNGPAQVDRHINASVDGTTLKINKLSGSGDAYLYTIYIDGYYAVSLKFNGNNTYLTVDLSELVDKMVSSGILVVRNKYKISIYASDEAFREGNLVATCDKYFNYTPSVQAPYINQIQSSDIEYDKSKGLLKWKKVNNADKYILSINSWACWFNATTTSCQINKQIDWLIKSGYIEKMSYYTIRFKAVKNGNVIGNWENSYQYSSAAVKGSTSSIEQVKNLHVEKGVLKWDSVESAHAYRICLNDLPKLNYLADRNYIDINQIIGEEIYKGNIPVNSTCKITVEALEYDYSDSRNDPLVLARTNNYYYDLVKENNPLNISGKTAKVKYKKLRKKKQTLNASQVINGLDTARGAKTFYKVKGNKKISINKNTGKVTIKKGLRKKTYKIKIKVKAAGNNGYYASGYKYATIKIKVK